MKNMEYYAECQKIRSIINDDEKNKIIKFKKGAFYESKRKK